VFFHVQVGPSCSYVLRSCASLVRCSSNSGRRRNFYLPPVSDAFRPSPRTPCAPARIWAGPCWSANLFFFLSFLSFLFSLFSFSFFFFFLFFRFFFFVQNFVFLFKLENCSHFEFYSNFEKCSYFDFCSNLQIVHISNLFIYKICSSLKIVHFPKFEKKFIFSNFI
jgi:hypothetical protein